MTIQFYNGVPLFVNGAPAMDPACCCGGIDCGGCAVDTGPDQIDVTMPTLTPGDGCPSCGGSGATYRLDFLTGDTYPAKNSGQCIWQLILDSPPVGCAEVEKVTATMSWDSGAGTVVWEIQIDGHPGGTIHVFTQVTPDNWPIDCGDITDKAIPTAVSGACFASGPALINSV